MKTQLNRELEIFEDAIALPPSERAAYLQSACAGDEKLRRQVQALLDAHADAGTFMQSPPAPVARDGLLPNEAATLLVAMEKAGDRIGRYKLLQQIGEGGMGVVYMAEQEEPVRRRVALKIIKLGMDTRQVVARFEAERQALALMDHPNIAKVLDGGATETPVSDAEGRARHSVRAESQPAQSGAQGTDAPYQLDTPHSAFRTPHFTAGRPYFVMELVKGQPLTKFCDEHKLSTRERLELFIPICQAIQHAHQKGIIHRDIKPSNILVTTIDGVPRPKVIDFGVAKATDQKLTGKTLFTNFDTMIGTPAYMSPEQAALDSTDIDTRSDIYSLGVLLYELLTGKTPIEAKELTRGGYDEIRRRIREIEPPRPSNRLSTLTGDELTTVARSRAIEPARLPRLIRGELDWIVLKAIDKDRSRRYETASAFAQDIRRYLDGEPVTAVKPSPIYQFRKFARRHKVVLATAACFALLLTVSACVAAAQAIKNKSLFTAAEEARLKAMTAQQREAELRRIAETERDRSGRLLYAAHMNLAHNAWDGGDLTRVRELLDQHHPQPGEPDMRSFEWFYLDRLTHRDLLTLKGHNGFVTSVAFSPDGKRLASSGKGGIKVWDMTSGEELITLDSPGAQKVAFSPDGKWLAGSGKGTVKIWDTTSYEEVRIFQGESAPNPTHALVFSPDSRRVASASGYPPRKHGELKVWDVITGQELLTLKRAYAFWSVAFSPDGKRLAFSSGDWGHTTKPCELKICDASTGQEMLTLKGHGDGPGQNAVNSLTFSPDGKRLASVAGRGTLKLWDATSGEEILKLDTRGRGNTLSVTFSPDGKRLASAGWGQMVEVWDATTGKETFALKGHAEVSINWRSARTEHGWLLPATMGR